LAAKLPVGRTEEEAKQRKDMFKTIDQNGSGQISLAELDLGIKVFLGEECFLLKPAIKEAFKAAKDQDPDDGEEDHFVEMPEFRLLMVYLRQYIELYCAFDHIDSGDDNRIDFGEFEATIPMLKEWGIEVEDARATFDEIDDNGGGIVLFNEFASWAFANGLDYDKSLDGGDATAADIVIKKKKKPTPKPKPKKKKKEEEK